MYKHTQTGWVIIISLGIALFLTLFLWVYESVVIGMIMSLVVLFAIIALGSLTVSVTEDYILAVFGAGIIRKQINKSDVVSAEIIRTKWWYGFGIHGWWGKGWVLNVSGFGAVELKLKNGMVYIIGTDEPEKLKDAINL